MLPAIRARTRTSKADRTTGFAICASERALRTTPSSLGRLEFSASVRLGSGARVLEACSATPACGPAPPAVAVELLLYPARRYGFRVTVVSAGDQRRGADDCRACSDYVARRSCWLGQHRSFGLLCNSLSSPCRAFSVDSGCWARRFTPGFIPARAGQRNSLAGGLESFPGISPRVRGSCPRTRGSCCSRRCIPARAAHPTDALAAFAQWRGRSPRVRGSFQHPDRPSPRGRSIPARAGQVLMVASTWAPLAVYPRACGAGPWRG